MNLDSPVPPEPRRSVFARSFPPERRRADAAALGLALAAGAAAHEIADALTRSLVLALCAGLAYVVGVFQPSPRR